MSASCCICRSCVGVVVDVVYVDVGTGVMVRAHVVDDAGTGGGCVVDVDVIGRAVVGGGPTLTTQYQHKYQHNTVNHGHYK